MKQITITTGNLDEVLPAVNYFLAIRDIENAIKLVRATRKVASDHPCVVDARKAVADALLLKYADFLSGEVPQADLVRLYAQGAAKKIRIDREVPIFSETASKIISENRTLLYYDRLYTIYQSILNVAHMSGDILELGVYKGGSLKFIAEVCSRFPVDAQIYGLDTYAGHMGVDSEHDARDDYSIHSDGMFRGDGIETVAQYLADYENVHLVKGDACHTLEGVLAKVDRLIFAHLDMDIYAPTSYALPRLAEKLVCGGAILLDDYGFLTCPGAKQAVDEFLEQIPAIRFHLMTGQMIIIK